MSIRFKMTTAALAVILVANSLLSVVTLQYLSRAWMGEVQTRVQRNLNAARAAYQNHTAKMAAFLRGVALDRTLASAAAGKDSEELRAKLHNLHRAGGMDFVTLLDTSGKVLGRAQNSLEGDDLSSDPLVALAQRQGELVTGTVIFSRERLLAENAGLAERARFELVPTPAERPTNDEVRFDGMVAAAAVPVMDGQGKAVAILYGGDLLNRRYEIVDAIKQQVFRHELYREKQIGTVTIFQDDLRISTNVTMDDGARAVGTRMSESVCEAILDLGGTWGAPAFVVNDWYITAYEPIRDPTGQVVGALYVGLLQAPFTHQRNVISTVFLVVVGVATLASLLLLYVAHALVLRPIQLVATMAQKIIGGDLSARVGIRPPGEMGVLCRAVDSMAEAVAEREELRDQATRQQIGRSEQLASIGRLAAGVAHEINNPLTGVLAFSDLLRQKENMDEQDRQDLDVIVRETKRAREIVRGLLDFARETPSLKTRLNINDVLRQTTRLFGKPDAFEQITLVEDLADHLPPVDGDKNQLQQVFLNLCLNACEAMPDGGTLLVSTSCEGERVVVRVTDTGSGIKLDHLHKVFEPFFTTKAVGKGTGLGLSVSYGILQQHGGTLEVESEEGKGSTFIIRLPAARLRR